MTNEATVIVVDDHEAVRDSLDALLSAAGYRVRTYGLGQDFISAFEPSLQGCLLLDLRLPDMDGIEVQEKLAAMGSRLRTVIISGHGDVPLAVKAMKAGAVDFIEKPYTEATILECVRDNLVVGEEAGSEAAAKLEIVRRLSDLTPREREVLESLVSGQPNKLIAYHLNISPRTVEIHRARVMSKMQAMSLSHLVRMALAAGVDSEMTWRSRRVE